MAAAAQAGPVSALAVQALEKRYGGVAALSGCSFDLAGPGIYGLIGPNGAGKTTLFDVIAGATEPDAGQVTLDGRTVTGFAPYRLERMGVARSFQECRVFPEYTCLENLRFSCQPKGFAQSLRALALGSTEAPEQHEEALRLLELVRLEAHAGEPAAALSFGQRRLLEIVAAFLQRPRLLLLDEPSAGVNPALLEILAAFIRKMYQERPCVFLVIEHNMEFIMELAAEIIVMHQGAVLERGSPREVQASARVIEAYLG